MVISYIYLICWHMKTSFYERQHSHSLRPSSIGGGRAVQALTLALDLFDSGSSVSDAEPAVPVPARKRP
jgi:hypothetical protein